MFVDDDNLFLKLERVGNGKKIEGKVWILFVLCEYLMQIKLMICEKKINKKLEKHAMTYDLIPEIIQ